MTTKDAYGILADTLPDILLGNILSYMLPKIKGEFLVSGSNGFISTEIVRGALTIAEDYRKGVIKIDEVDMKLDGLCDSVVVKHQLGDFIFADYSFTQTILALNERGVWLAFSIREIFKGTSGGTSGLKVALPRIQELIAEAQLRSMRDEGSRDGVSQLIYNLEESARELFYKTLKLEEAFKGGNVSRFIEYIQSKVLETAANKYSPDEYSSLKRRLGDEIDKFKTDSTVRKRFYWDWRDNISPFFLLDYFVALAREDRSR
jgi:hypothetical protein